MTDKIFRRVISSMLIIASSTYEVVLAMALSLVAGSLGLAIAKE